MFCVETPPEHLLPPLKFWSGPRLSPSSTLGSHRRAKTPAPDALEACSSTTTRTRRLPLPLQSALGDLGGVEGMKVGPRGGNFARAVFVFVRPGFIQDVSYGMWRPCALSWNYRTTHARRAVLDRSK